MQDYFLDNGRALYKPFVTRAPILLFLLLCTFSLIALSEVATRSLPAHAGVGTWSKVADELNQTLYIDIGRNVERRQWTSIDSTNLILEVASSATSISADLNTEPTSAYYPSATGTVGPEGPLILGDGSIPIPPPDPTTQPGFTPTPTPPGPPADGDVNSQPEVVPTPVGQPNGNGGRLDTGGNTAPAAPAGVNPVPGNPTVLYTATDGHLIFPGPTGTGNTHIPVGNTPAPASPAPLLVIANGQTSTLTPIASPTPKNPVSAAITSEPLVVIVDNKESTLSSGQLATKSNGEPFSLITKINGQTFTVVGGAAPSAPSNVKGSKPSDVNNAVVPTATFVNSTGTYLAWSNGGITIAPRITLVQYVLVTFLPIMLAVIYTIPWRILDSTLRELEPFFQLARPGGALAEHSLCLNYGSSFLMTMPFKAMFRGHFIVFWSSLISIAVLLLAPLSSEAFFVSLSGVCGANLPSSGCHAVWGVYPGLVRGIQGILAFVAVLLVLLLGFVFNRNSGVYSEPLSIVGLASLLYKSPVLKDLREIDSQVKKKELKSILSGRRYALSYFMSSDQIPCYGIVNFNLDVETGLAAKAARAGNKGRYKLVIGSESKLVVDTGVSSFDSTHTRGAKMWWILQEKLYYVAAFILLGGLLALIAYYHWTSADTGFERFMNSQGFGVKFMMTSLGVIVKLFWGGIDQDLRQLAPFDRLLQGSSNPDDSILVPIWTSPFAAIIPALRRKHYFVALICFFSVLSEFLPICLANISFSPAVTKQTYEVCNGISMGVLILMVGCILALILRPMRGRPLPRSPRTVASVGVYLARRESEWAGEGHGGLMDELEGCSIMERKERDDFVREKGALYAMGVVNGDGLRIDEERRIDRLWTY
ncbi:uncharacterized protein L3040_006574 [Drepanopeziza brunnea f. sp. 'multigermtubi']|uniref:uncharacterized protein n=1 Tax=Drepanopeziza brunnea f. sp. 'multigermtubi' TaxID=698441 RepID=UPI0023A1CBA5|nr:hypothetical protein L3040_006574 [Drepanopeziza brunnea f. sp. 'multigermtubi']